jgi:FkbM family methyltransferase
MPNWLRIFIDRLGYQVTKNRARSVETLLKSRNIDHVIDVGANKGQFALFIRSCGYSGLITAFEPIDEHRSTLERLAPIRVISAAVGEHQGSVPINIYSSTDFSSIHRLGDDYAQNYKNAPTLVATRTVELTNLDSFQFPGTQAFLKIDTQGSEAQVLRGGVRALKQVSVLQMEMPFLGIYDNGNSVSELFELTSAAGLYPARFFANQIDPSGAWVDGDVFFVRKARR